MTEFNLFPSLLIYLLSVLGALCNELTLNIHDKVIKTTGDSLAVICSGTDIERLKWRKGKEDIKKSERLSNIKGELTLLLNSISIEDAGNYTCYDTKKLKKHTSFQLIVQVPIEFKGTKRTVIGTEGDNYLIVPCEAKGPRAPTIRWAFPPGISNRNTTGKLREGGDGLYIHNLSAEDTGVYTCKAMIEELSQVKIRNIHVIVNHKPRAKWDESVENTPVYINDKTTANLSCLATAYPEPTARWYLNDIDIPTWPISYYLEAVSEGRYECVVSNEYGNVTRSFTVKEGFRPGPPTKVIAHNVTHNSLQITSKVPKVTNEHKITGYILEVRERQGRYNRTFHFSSGPPFSISGLKQDTTYLVKLKAVNQIGHGDFSPEIEASTSTAASTIKFSLLPIASCVTALYYILL